MTPQGKPLQQADLRRWAGDYEQLVLLCGHYEGFDERIRSLADEEVSLGDFVLTGGELPAMTIINGTVRLRPGTVGTADSLVEESHSAGLLGTPITPVQPAFARWRYQRCCAAGITAPSPAGARSSKKNAPSSAA